MEGTEDARMKHCLFGCDWGCKKTYVRVETGMVLVDRTVGVKLGI